MANRKSDFITEVRNEASTVLDAIADLHALRAEWDALGYGASLTDDSFDGENEDIDSAAIAAVFSTLEAIDALLAQGHATNLYKVFR